MKFMRFECGLFLTTFSNLKKCDFACLSKLSTFLHVFCNQNILKLKINSVNELK